MEIRHVTYDSLQSALDSANRQFDGNIRFKRLDCTGRTRQGTSKFAVTLTVKDSRAPGHRRATEKVYSDKPAQYLSAACWHAHKAFMDGLPASAEVKSTFGTWHPGEMHHDRNAGSQLLPQYLSELCDCNE